MLLISEVVCQLLAVTGFYVCTCMVLELQLLRLFNSIFNSINTDFAVPQFPMRWRDGGLMYINIHGFGILV